MKRPALAAAVIVTATLAAGYLLPSAALLAVCIAAGVFLAVSIIIKNKRLLFVLAFAFLALLSLTLKNMLVFNSDASLEGRTVTVSARVEKVKGDGIYVLKPVSVYEGDTEIKVRGKIDAHIYGANKPGRFQAVTGDFMLKIPGHGFASKGGYYAKGISLCAYSKGTCEISDDAPAPVYDLTYHLDRYIMKQTDRIGGEEGAFVNSLLTGDNSGLSDETYDDFRVMGLTHIMAVSGLHLSIIMGIFYAIFRKIRVSRTLKQVFCIAVILLVCTAADFSASVCRAGIMGIIACFGAFFGRSGESLNSLGGSAAIYSLINPYAMFDAGFILSITATFGIIIVMPALTKLLTEIRFKPLRLFMQTICVSASASAVLLPVSVAYFDTASWVGVISNAVFDMLVYLILAGGMLLCFVGFIPYISEVFVYALRFAAGIMLKAVQYFGSRISLMEFESGPLLIWLALVVAVCALCLIFGKRVKRGVVAAVLAVSFAVSFAAAYRYENQEMTLYSENSDKMCLQYLSDGEDIIVTDCKNSLSALTLYSLLNESGVGKCELAVLGDYADGRVDAVKFMIDNKLTRRILIPDIEEKEKYDIIKKAKANGIEIIMADDDVGFDAGGFTVRAGLYMDMAKELYPDRMWLWVKYEDFTALNTYDAEYLPTSVHSDVVFCDVKAAERKASDWGRTVVNGASVSGGGEICAGKGYITECRLYDSGKYKLIREKQ